jgi:pyruvate ferredoxin oxidoreductase alpha subunit
MKRVGMEGSFAIAEAVKLADVDAIAAYPITPQTHIVERIAELVANGELNASYVPVESEHSAMSACLGSSAVGARTFTATAGQGLELMHEVLYVASSMRLPIVMVVANRALSAPLSVWGDHSDAMAVRDCGWIQIFAENVQQAYDLLICAFRIGEDPSVLFPVMVHMDGFHLSHIIESLHIIDKDKINSFLPKYSHPYSLNPDKPVSLGAFGPPNIYTEAKKSQDTALRATKSKISQVWQEFGDLTGRHYFPVENYKTEDSEVLLITMGSFSENAMIAIDEMHDKGLKVGLVRLRLWRPFPFDEFRHSVKDAKLLIVMDRAISFGGPSGPVCSEIQSALYPLDAKPKVISFVGGLGGRDVDAQTFKNLVIRGIEMAKGNYTGDLEIIEVRE